MGSWEPMLGTGAVSFQEDRLTKALASVRPRPEHFPTHVYFRFGSYRKTVIRSWGHLVKAWGSEPMHEGIEVATAQLPHLHSPLKMEKLSQKLLHRFLAYHGPGC